jgi:hypothetical protein
VYEALAADAANQAVVVYTTDEAQVEGLANQLVAQEDTRALLVADECSLQVRVNLERRLAAHRERLRVIAIDNDLREDPIRADFVRLARMSAGDVEAILTGNYQTLLAERTRAYASLAEGFIRLAVDLCRHDRLVPPEGNIGQVIPFFREHYLERRLGGEELNALLLVSLLARVGYRGDVEKQLADLCDSCPAAGLGPERVVVIARRLKQSPRFPRDRTALSRRRWGTDP